jgi:hypothetical protein
MPQPFVPLEIEPEPPFWPRLAKGAMLIFMGVAAHQWLLPAHDQRVADVAVVQLDAPRETPRAYQSGASPQQNSTSEIALPPPLESAPPADSVRLTPVGTTGAASMVRPDLHEPKPRADAPAAIDPPTKSATTASSAPASPNGGGPMMDDPLAAGSEAAVSREGPSAGTDAKSDIVVPAARVFPAHLALATLTPIRGPGVPSRGETAVRHELATRGQDEGDLEERVLRIVQEYRAAYESLDVAAARIVWPSVDHVALTHAFRQLAAQRLTFESCGISVSGASALARCRGQAEYIPKVGAQRALMASGEWVFDLARHDTDWKIVSASVH